ncbi:MAG: ATP-binding protein [Deltaproteobacteria bacterium]|nr:ATP-binding protein [Deltaproteobacteria bacterium]
MVFVGGPRQVGKTTLSFSLLKNGSENHPAYLNWDFPPIRDDLMKGILPLGQKVLVLDEIHKYSEWRNLVKGIFDRYKSQVSILVTGSARLDFYRRGGDSLQGRYHYYRLHPFSYLEIAKTTQDPLGELLRFGGFPEPFLLKDEVEWKRWQRERKTRVIAEDLISLEQVNNISKLDTLVSLLPSRVGSVLSINSLKEDLLVAHETVSRWIEILENLYYCYRISPYTTSKIKGMKKEKKLYLWDWSLCPTEGSRWENLVASHLLKYCHFHEDTMGEEMNLFFIRDKEKREIDFLVCKGQTPMFAVECKHGRGEISPHVHYFSKRTSIPKFYQVYRSEEPGKEFVDSRAELLPFSEFCRKILKI